MISMLHQWANHPNKKKRHVYWIHGARNGSHHPFVIEVEEIQRMVLTGEKDKSLLTTHIAYSQPTADDTGAFHHQGRLTPSHIATLVPNIDDADIYMCGSDAFVAEMNEGLVDLGVPTSHIHYETF